MQLLVKNVLHDMLPLSLLAHDPAVKAVPVKEDGIGALLKKDADLTSAVGPKSHAMPRADVMLFPLSSSNWRV